MTAKSRKPTVDDFTLQPSEEQPRQEQGPVAPKVEELPIDPTEFDPAWTHEAPYPAHMEPEYVEPAPVEPAHLEPNLDAAPAEETSGDAEGPGPSVKVDFENLPEFVWQRNMLKKVRKIAVIAFAVITVIVVYFVFFAGKKTKDVIIEGIEKKRDITQEPETK